MLEDGLPGLATDLLSTETLTGATSATRKYAYDANGRRSTMADGANRYSYQYDPHGSVSLLLDQTGTAKVSCFTKVAGFRARLTWWSDRR
jgi:hypothetical protein